MPEARKASGGLLPAGEGRWSFSSDELWWRHIWSAVLSSELSIQDTWAYWRKSSKEPQKWVRDWNISSMEEKLGELELFSLEREGALINVYKYVKRKCKEDEAMLLSVMPSDRIRGYGHNQGYQRCDLYVRKHFCIVRRIEQGNQRHCGVCLLRGICNLTGHSSEYPSLCAPARGEVEADGLGSPCQPQPFCDSGVMDNCF